MKTTELFQTKTTFSFEVFPPKRTDSIDTIYRTLDKLQGLRPDFISVTYGAGGSANCTATLEIASAIKHKYKIESVAHLPGIGLTKADVLSQLRRFETAGIENILALRGDIPSGSYFEGDFPHASDLISFIKEYADFNIIAACYPEAHTESENILSDIRHLKTKVDAGASQLIAGIHVPIEAGIMPVINKKQIERMVTLCGVHLPKKFTAMMERYENNPEAMRDAGIAYAIDQIVDLNAQGVDGIHLYTMNNPYIAEKIYEAVHRLLAA